MGFFSNDGNMLTFLSTLIRMIQSIPLHRDTFKRHSVLTNFNDILATFYICRPTKPDRSGLLQKQKGDGAHDTVVLHVRFSRNAQ